MRVRQASQIIICVEETVPIYDISYLIGHTKSNKQIVVYDIVGNRTIFTYKG